MMGGQDAVKEIERYAEGRREMIVINGKIKQ